MTSVRPQVYKILPIPSSSRTHTQTTPIPSNPQAIVNLHIWEAAEISVTIIAASIPILRVFVAEKARQYSSGRSRKGAQTTGDPSHNFSRLGGRPASVSGAGATVYRDRNSVGKGPAVYDGSYMDFEMDDDVGRTSDGSRTAVV